MARFVALLALVVGFLPGVASAQPIPGERMSHSIDSETITDNGSILCTVDAPIYSEGWMRAYDADDYYLTADFSLIGVEFAVESFSGTGYDSHVVEIYVYEDTDPAYPVLFDDLIEVYAGEATIYDDDDLSVVFAELDPPVAMDAGAEFVIQIRHPDFPTSVDDRFFVVAANSAGQTGPSYFVGADEPDEGPCSVDPTDADTAFWADPVDLAALCDPTTGVCPFAGIHLIIDPIFDGGCVPPRDFTCEIVGDDVVLSWTNSGRYDSIDIRRDGAFLDEVDGDLETFTDIGAANTRRQYLLRAYQDDYDCDIDSLRCTTEYNEQCREEVELFIGFDLSPASDVLDFGSNLQITDLDVLVDISHTWAGDLTIDLTSPTATEVTLKDTADIPWDDLRVIFDDEGYDLRDTQLALGQRFIPEGPGTLADFDDEGSAGDWTLTISDADDFDDGFLNRWCLRVLPVAGSSFKRGDADGNGTTSVLSDALALLRWAFLGGTAPPCMDAADVDGNNSVSALGDATYLLRWNFAGGAIPPDPGPTSCGNDPDEDLSVGCATPPAVCN